MLTPKFEWIAKPSDKDAATWNTHPSLIMEVGWSESEDKDDEGFWMSFEDFDKIFDMLGVCMSAVSQGVHGPGMPAPALVCMGSKIATGHRQGVLYHGSTCLRDMECLWVHVTWILWIAYFDLL